MKMVNKDVESDNMVENIIKVKNKMTSWKWRSGWWSKRCGESVCVWERERGEERRAPSMSWIKYLYSGG